MNFRSLPKVVTLDEPSVVGNDRFVYPAIHTLFDEASKLKPQQDSLQIVGNTEWADVKVNEPQTIEATAVESYERSIEKDTLNVENNHPPTLDLDSILVNRGPCYQEATIEATAD